MSLLIQRETVFAVRSITCVRGLNESNEYFFQLCLQFLVFMNHPVTVLDIC